MVVTTKSLKKRPLKERPYAKKFTGESRTKQQFKDDADIHTIINKYNETGSWGDRFRSAQRVPTQGDFTKVSDYKESIDIVIHAQESFSELPSRLRNYFNNDPVQLLAFLNDVNNKGEAIRLGLIEPDVNSEVSPSQKPETPKTGDSTTPVEG